MLTLSVFISYQAFKLCPTFSILSGNPMSRGSFLLASPRQQTSWLAAPCSAAVVSGTSANFVIQWAMTIPSVTKSAFQPGLWCVCVGGVSSSKILPSLHSCTAPYMCCSCIYLFIF